MNSFIPLYEIDKRLAEAFDEETGELLISEEELDNIFAQEAKGVEYFIRLYKNSLATAAAYKDEIKRLEAMAEKYEKVAEKAINVIDKHQAGHEFECTSGCIKYRKSTKVEPFDEMAFLQWDGRFQYGKSEFTPSKNDIKRAIKAGTEIPGWGLRDYNNISIK